MLSPAKKDGCLRPLLDQPARGVAGEQRLGERVLRLDDDAALGGEGLGLRRQRSHRVREPLAKRMALFAVHSESHSSLEPAVCSGLLERKIR